LNYVGNAGWSFADPSRNSPPSSIGKVMPSDNEWAANGVFFDYSKNPDIINSSARDGREGYPPMEMTISYINSNDGTSKTMMVSENVHTWYYAYDGDPGTELFEPPFDANKDFSMIVDDKHVFGFVWSNNPMPIERINGDNNYDKSGAQPTSMAEFASQNGRVLGYPSSFHPAGVNVAFCDGHIVFMSENIEPRVYAMLMTSNSKRSKFFDRNNGDTPDRRLPQPSDADF
jgi:prepilin-type processing-associated H-X9-DG protein